MVIIDRLQDLLQTFFNSLVGIPLDNELSILYVAANLLLQLYGLFLGGFNLPN